MQYTEQGSATSRRQETRLRRRFLMTVMSAGILWGGLMTVPAQLGWAPIGQIQTNNNTAFFVLNCILLLVLWRSPRLFLPIAIIYFTAGFLYITAAQFLVLEDQLRMLLFFPAVGAVFLILGGLAAWIMILGALGVFAASVATHHIDVSPLAASTFIITLSVTGVFFHTFRAQARAALNTIAEQNAALDASARQDHLTHLLNLRAFRQTMQQHHAGGAKGDPFCVAFIDVDHFKSINDRHGHAGGDAVLVALAGALNGAVRAGDVVARIGGEEFAILLPRTGLPEALRVAERLRDAVQGMRVELATEVLTVTISIGIAAAHAPLGSVDAVLQAADAAMYAAKAQGRNRIIAAPAAPGGDPAPPAAEGGG